MATDAELTAAGFILPTGNDYISGGDDALRANAAAAYDDTRKVAAGPQIFSGDANTLLGQSYTIPSGSAARAVTNLPVEWPGTLRVSGVAPILTQTYSPAYIGNNAGTGAGLAPMYVRRTTQAGGWHPWEALWPGTPNAGSREGSLRLDALRARVGPVTVTTPAAVTIVMDHGLTNVKNKILPLLRARGLTATLAINSGLWGDANNSGAIDADVKTWGDVFEFANHGRTHLLNGSTAADLTEIETGRTELETQLGVPIDTWVQTGNSTGYTFADGNTPEGYWTTSTGVAITRTHAVWTGLVPHPTRRYPLDGHPKPGAQGYWIDAATDTAQAQITSAISEGSTGVIVRLHPQFLDTAGYITTAQLTAFLDWLVARRTAGEVTVLTYRAWSIARAPIGSTVGRAVATAKDAATARAAIGAAPAVLDNWRRLAAPDLTGDILYSRAGTAFSLVFSNVRGFTGTYTLPDTLPVGLRPRVSLATSIPSGGSVTVSYAGVITVSGVPASTTWVTCVVSYVPGSLNTPATYPGTPA